MSGYTSPAVGVMRDGNLILIEHPDHVRGLILKAIIVGTKHQDIFRQNEDVLRASFRFSGPGGVADENNGGEIIYLEGDEETPDPEIRFTAV